MQEKDSKHEPDSKDNVGNRAATQPSS